MASSVALTPFALVFILFLQLLACSPAPFSTHKPGLDTRTHPLSPSSSLWKEVSGPLPTNKWWQNFGLGNGQDSTVVTPYSVKLNAGRIDVGLPDKDASDTIVEKWFRDGIVLTSSTSNLPHYIVDYDILAVTLRFGNSSSYFDAPLVPGSPYITGLYNNLAPKISSLNQIKSVNGHSTHGVVEGSKFTLELSNNQTWIIYLNKSATFKWSIHDLTPSFTGGDWSVRVAALPPTAANVQSAESLLDSHSSVIVTGASFDTTFSSTRAHASLTWRSVSMSAVDAEVLPLMLALPHHQDVLQSNSSDLEYDTIVGTAKAYALDVWKWDEVLTTLSWTAKRGVDPTRKAAILDALVHDANDTLEAGDPYFFGKEISRVARLALIADELGETHTASAIITKLKEALAPWVNGSNDDPLLYDRTWGGVVPLDGLHDSGADFGAGYYNDHHFHYGYFIYAAAVLAKFDASWGQENKEWVLALARDIANPSAEDAYFTQYRYFDWYSGHSWAAGLFEFQDGRNQESTSEAMNAWYGLYLFGLATKDSNVENVGRLLLAAEMRGAQRYWHSTSAKSVYPAEFAAGKCAGMVWSDKVDSVTWFGAGAVYSHGINMMPFTPITEEYLDKAWVAEEYPVVSDALRKGSYADEWAAIVYLDHAILDAKVAWEEVNGVTDFGGGNSLTNALWWVATRD